MAGLDVPPLVLYDGSMTNHTTILPRGWETKSDDMLMAWRQEAEDRDDWDTVDEIENELSLREMYRY